MAKRLHSTTIWEEDWFIDMPVDYRLFWFYVKDKCDQAGVFKVNIKTFCITHQVDIDVDVAVELFNKGKERIRKVNGSSWLIEDFFVFQYGQTLNLNNRVHESIKEIYSKVGVKLGSIRGIKEVKERSK